MATITQIQQPAKFIQPGLTTVTTTTPVDSGYANAQVAKTVAVSNTNAVFAVLGLLMGIALTVLNAIPIASGTRVYGGAYAKDPNSYDPGLYPSHNANYYPGFWYGLLNVFACVIVIVYCQTVKNKMKADPGYIIANTSARSYGALQATLFGLIACVGIAAVITGAITTFVLDHSYDSFTDCTFDSTANICYCTNSYYVTSVSSCQYTWTSLFNIYRALTGLASFLVVVDIVIASLFCGMLCCCVTMTPYVQMDAPRLMSVTTAQGGYIPGAATVVTTDVGPPPAYYSY